MYKKNLFKKSLVVGIIVMFIGAGAATGINSKIDRHDINEKTLKTSSNQNICSLTFHTFDKTDEKQNNVNLPIESANKIYETLEELKYLIVHKSRSDETQNLKNEFVDLLDTYGLIPAGLSKDYVLSLLNPSWLKNKQKIPRTRTILSKSYISPVAEKIVNLQQIFKNSFGKTILNIFNKKTIISPSSKTTATASFCSISSGGSGTTLPIFLLPRPRAIAAWTAPEAITMVGVLLTGKGFYAGGEQSGSMLGFTGMGLTYSLPGYIVYGFVGYALYTKVSADYIEFVNREPVISDENPPNGDYDVPVSLSKLSFRLSDLDGDLMNYTVTTEPNIGSGSGNNKKNGIYTVSISRLEGDTKYTWHVVVKDEYNTVEEYFTFTTEAVAPVVSNPIPPDKTKYITVNLSKLSFKLKDFQGDLMDYTVETSPNIGSSSGNDVGDGTYTCDVNGLKYSTEYKWYVNVTDGVHWTHKVFNFQTELKMVFNPFEEGWHYRKQITIDHNMVTGDLINFPVLINTIDTDLRDKAQDDGDDILFMDGLGVAIRLYHEIELFNGSSGELVAWVNISDLSSSANTSFYIYYGNPDCSDQECPELVWDTNFILVQHFEEQYSTALDNYRDSTTKANHGTLDDNDLDSSQTNGKIGKAINLKGDSINDDDITCSNNELPIGNSQRTISIWIKPHHVSVNSFISYGVKETRKMLVLDIHSNSKYRFLTWGDDITTTTNADVNIWQYITATYDGIVVDMYLNSTKIGTKNIALETSDTNFYIGSWHFHDNPRFDGEIDEVTVSKIVRSIEWINTSYNTMNSPETFVSFGSEETSP